jgi:hypothetical protein
MKMTLLIIVLLVLQARLVVLLSVEAWLSRALLASKLHIYQRLLSRSCDSRYLFSRISSLYQHALHSRQPYSELREGPLNLLRVYESYCVDRRTRQGNELDVGILYERIHAALHC